MGQPENSKVIIVILCLLLTSMVIFLRDATVSKVQPKSTSLSEALAEMGPWLNEGDITMPDKVVSALQLDDYCYRQFSCRGKNVTLYIGYYYAAKKVGAAHDPMVCFPGQGWILSDISKGVLSMPLAGGKFNLHYSTMIAERNAHRELLVYWFQADDQATSNTLSQKIVLLCKRFLGGSENNAFVRIDTSLDDQTRDAGLALIKEFMRDLYPQFINYIQGPVSRGGSR